MKTVGISQFVRRQTKSDFAGTKVTEADLDRLASLTQAQMAAHEGVQPGYDTFCKIVIIDNGMLKENDGYEHFDIRTSYLHRDELDLQEDNICQAGYESRREGEPAMPTTPSVSWLGELPLATHIHCVLYTREQLEAEGTEVGGCDWEIVSVNAEMGEKGAPMTPSTLIRNHLGPDFGGSGKKLDVDTYNESVEFWSNHVFIK